MAADAKNLVDFLKKLSSNNQTKEEESALKQLEDLFASGKVDAIEKPFSKLVEILTKKNPTYVSKQDKNGLTMLHFASWLGLVHVTELLLQKGASTAIEDNTGTPPLAYAERGKNDRIVNILLEEKVRVSMEEERTANYLREIHRLKSLIENKDMTGLEKALGTKDVINCEDKAGATLLQVASFHGNLDAIKLLLSKGANVNSKDNDNISSLHKAVIGFHVDCVKFLLSNGANVNAVDNDGLTALHHACYHGKLDIVKLLLAAGAKVNVQDNDKTSPLHHAVSGGHADIVEYLLRNGAEVNTQDAKGATALHIAAHENQVRCASALLANKADYNQRDSEGLTPVHHSCFNGHVDITRILLEQKGVKFNDADHAGSTPLHKACYHGHLECGKLLIDKGAEVNFEDGTTSPLHHAAFGGHTGCIELLLKKGAIINCHDSENATPLHKAAFNGHIEAVKLLLEEGADPASQDEEGSTPLHKAAFSGKGRVIQLLLQFGAEVDCQDGDDGTPLHNACFNGHLECVKLLLASQANFNSADDKGASPLHLAVLNGHKEVAHFLVESGAQVDSPDDRGMTALHHAIAHTTCLQFLLDKGAEVDCRDHSRRTPLFYAAKNSCEEPARFLILKGADLYAKDKNGQTPLDIARPSFQRVLLSALKERASAVDVDTQKKYQTAVKLFNQKPQKGIEYLISNGIIKGAPEELVKFLHTAENLNKKQIGELLGEHDQYNQKLLACFVGYMDFTGLDFDDALRHFLSKFVLPGEAQKIDRMMERFAIRFVENNPTVFPHQDTAYVLAFSLIMLNTDAHSPHIKNKMTKEEFIRNNRGICGGASLPKEYMENLYDKIVENEIKMQAEGSVFTSAERKGWCRKQGGRWKTWKKRWFVLKDNCLYYFKQMEDKDPYGIIPLENLQVRPFEVKGRKFAFEVYSSSGEIKSCKLENGQLVRGHHGSYLIEAETQQEMDAWIGAIRNNISFNPLFEMIKKRMAQPTSPNNSRSTVIDAEAKGELVEIHDACMMCSMAYKTPKQIKEAYGMHAHVIEDSDRSLRYYLLINERSKSQIVVLCGSVSESVVQASIDNNSPIDVYSTFAFDKAAEQIDGSLVKYLKKDYGIQIFGHSLGAALALLFTLHLQNEGFKVEKLITFGQPKVIREKEASQYKSLPVVRIVDYYDPVPTLFSGYVHSGPEIVLFRDQYYSNLKDHSEEHFVDKRYDANHIESYLRNLKGKLKAATSINYDDRQTILQKKTQP
eukprot:TRINITY_DN1840_c0_g1_i1.p1 TRINITY_DN1840_c0_g1~~TRINITY_DN1840_c0_g1_i1.p1  ORF type:complete len:1243 (-),score=449.77 TRINITY_DN1840_c0_g1_i1:160-3888(-)